MTKKKTEEHEVGHIEIWLDYNPTMRKPWRVVPAEWRPANVAFNDDDKEVRWRSVSGHTLPWFDPMRHYDWFREKEFKDVKAACRYRHERLAWIEAQRVYVDKIQGQWRRVL